MSNYNQPAFPTIEHGFDKVGNPTVFTTEGMTLRDYFAAKAMQELISNSYYSLTLSGNSVFPVPADLSEKSYTIADQMLKAGGYLGSEREQTR